MHRRRHLALALLRNRKLDVPHRRWSGHPRGTQHAIVIAVHIAQIRRKGIGREERRTLVEAAFELGALPSAGLVATGYQDHPVFGTVGGFGRGGRSQGRLPVVLCYRHDVFGGDFRGTGVDGVGHGGGDEGFGFFEPALEGWCEGAEGILGVGVGEDGEGEEEGGGKLHGCGWSFGMDGSRSIGVLVQ